MRDEREKMNVFISLWSFLLIFNKKIQSTKLDHVNISEYLPLVLVQCVKQNCIHLQTHKTMGKYVVVNGVVYNITCY